MSQTTMEPLHIREEFVLELEEAEKDREKQGGSTLKDIKRRCMKH